MINNKYPRIYLSPPHMCGKELEFVNEAFATNWIAPIGPHVDAFELEMCAFTGAAYAVALSSGTAALHLSLLLAGAKADDEVICSSFTFAASANAITYCGATPVFVDSDIASWNMDPRLLEKAIAERIQLGKHIAAVIVVHLYGQSADLDPIYAACEKYGIPLIEDAAESLGATYKKVHTGILGKMGIFSFNGNKIITTSGGGMLVSADKNLIDRARFLATQARDAAPHYEHSHIGYNYRMSNVCAGIGRGQLTMLDERVAARRRIHARYMQELGDIHGVACMPEAAFGRSNRWLTCITLDPAYVSASPAVIREALEKENIESRPLWKPMHLQPVFASAPAYVTGVSEKLFDTGICLPSGSSLTDADQDRVIACIRAVLKR